MLATVLSMAAFAVSVLTALFIWWQARELRKQNQLQAVIQLTALWDSVRMRSMRSQWAEDELKIRLTEDDRDLICLEPLMEFLEEFASLRKQKVLNDELVWDSTIGWHATRYYIYNLENGNVGRLRSKWLDATLYENLETLWDGYLEVESRERGIDEGQLRKQILETKGDFLEAEHNARRFSESSD